MSQSTQTITNGVNQLNLNGATPTINPATTNPFHLTAAEINSITDLAIVVALIDKIPAIEETTGRELNQAQENVLIMLEEQEGKLEGRIAVAVDQKALENIVKN